MNFILPITEVIIFFFDAPALGLFKKYSQKYLNICLSINEYVKVRQYSTTGDKLFNPLVYGILVIFMCCSSIL